MAEPKILPMLAYEDAAAAITYLCAVFGFEETFRFPMPDGSIGHAELQLEGQPIALATAWSAAGFTNPAGLGGHHAQLMCPVRDVEAHYAHAVAAGATIAQPPTDDHGSRSYRAVDDEGHYWIFSQPPTNQGADA